MPQAEQVIAFLNRLPISSGQYAGRPLVVRPWQEDILHDIYRPGRLPVALEKFWAVSPLGDAHAPSMSQLPIPLTS